MNNCEVIINLVKKKRLRKSTWNKNEFIELKEQGVVNQNGEIVDLVLLHDDKDFEIYIDGNDPINWIGKFCAFGDGEKENVVIAKLVHIYDNTVYKFVPEGGIFGFKECRLLTGEEMLNLLKIGKRVTMRL